MKKTNYLKIVIFLIALATTVNAQQTCTFDIPTSGGNLCLVPSEVKDAICKGGREGSLMSIFLPDTTVYPKFTTSTCGTNANLNPTMTSCNLVTGKYVCSAPCNVASLQCNPTPTINGSCVNNSVSRAGCATCGNAVVDTGETCDGSFVNDTCALGGDVCGTNCVSCCGNNQTETGEECDPPGDICAASGTRCNSACRCAIICGNNLVEAGQACDGTSNDNCASRQCVSAGSPGECTCVPSYCGDGQTSTPNSYGQREECEVTSDCAAGLSCIGCTCLENANLTTHNISDKKMVKILIGTNATNRFALTILTTLVGNEIVELQNETNFSQGKNISFRILNLNKSGVASFMGKPFNFTMNGSGPGYLKVTNVSLARYTGGDAYLELALNMRMLDFNGNATTVRTERPLHMVADRVPSVGGSVQFSPLCFRYQNMSQPIRLLNSTNATIGWILEMVNCMLNETIAPIIIQSSMPLVPTREAYDVVGSIDIQGTGGREVITVSGPAMLRRLEKNDTDGDSRNDTQLELMGLFLYGTSKQFGKVTLRNDFLKKTIGVIQAERRSRPEYPSQSLIRLNSVLDIPTSTGQLTSLNSSKPQFLVQQLVTTPFTACYNLQNITSSITNPPILFQSPNATVNVTMRGMTLCFNSGTAANMGLDLLLPGGARERVTLFGSIGLTQSDSGGQTINGTITSMRLRGRSASLGDIEAKLIGRATIGQINHIQREGQLFRSGNSYFDLFFQLITDNGTYNNGNLAPLRVEAQTFTVPNRECLQNRTLQTSPYNMSGAVIFDASLCPNFEGDLPKVQENFPPVGKDPIQVGLMMFLTTGNQNHMMTSSGRLLVQRGEPVTIVNQKTIFTEILDMFLEGFTTLLGNFTGNNITITNYTNISANINISGNITGSAAMPFPATSFFDMFFLIRADSVQLCNRVPARIQAVIFNIPSTICFNLINITDSRQPADPVELFVYNDTTKNCTSTQPVINGTAQQVLIRQIMMCPKFALGNRFVRGGFQQKIVIGEETQNSFSSEDVTRYTGVKPIEIRNNGSDLALVRFPFDFDRDDIDISQVEVNVTSIAGRPATYIARNIPLQSGRTKTIVLPVSIQSNKICIIDRSNVTQQEVENCTAGVNISNSTILDCPGQVNNPNDATVAIVCTINGSNYEISGVFNTGAGEVTPTSTAPGPTTVTQPSTFVLAPTAGRSGGGGLPKGSKTVCTDKCKAGEKTCEGTDGYKTCEVLNQCMDWSVKKKCQDGTKCEKGECVKPTPTTTAPVEIPKIEPPKIETPQTEKAIPIEREIPPEPKSDIAATIVFVLGLIISAALIWYAHRK